LTSNIQDDLIESISTSNPTKSEVSVSPEIENHSYSDLNSSEDLLTNLYKQVSPGVVSIQVNSDLGLGQGSGFVIDKMGHILTNFHVIENATTIEVDFPSGVKVYGDVIGTDIDSDLAIIKVNLDQSQLFPLELGDSDQLEVGQTVIAIGNPYGLSGSMTLGIISASGRVLDSLRQSSDGIYFSAGDLIQTDAAINPGNSGGPLLNLKAEVIGVNRAIQTSGNSLMGDSGNIGIGFAISSNIFKKVTPYLISQGFYDYPYLGISSLPSLNLTYQEALNLPQATGAYITNVVSGGPCDQAGLRMGSTPTIIAGLYAGSDLIIRVDEITVREFSDLLRYITLEKSPGDTMILTIIRDGEEIELSVILGKRP
jgi:2-alkenal reductase